ncbi:MAG: 7-carboxy-7-deazaguanine synthase QueE [Opitutales bacterium]
MLPIHEQFYSFQGEGVHVGRAAYFIRTYGCPVHCPWCDSAGTWHPDYLPEKIRRLEEAELAQTAAKSKAEFVVVTGGEPAIHDLEPLVDALHEKGLKVHLETSGAFPIQGNFDWITLSPKRWKLPLEACIRLADEFKIIVDQPDAIEAYSEVIAAAEETSASDNGQTRTRQGSRPPEGKPIWLHPEWSMREDAVILNKITEWVKTHGAPYRAGWQVHKPYQADILDPQSARPAPLGGKLERGY